MVIKRTHSIHRGIPHETLKPFMGVNKLNISNENLCYLFNIHLNSEKLRVGIYCGLYDALILTKNRCMDPEGSCLIKDQLTDKLKE